MRSGIKIGCSTQQLPFCNAFDTVSIGFRGINIGCAHEHPKHLILIPTHYLIPLQFAGRPIRLWPLRSDKRVHAGVVSSLTRRTPRAGDHSLHEILLRRGIHCEHLPILHYFPADCDILFAIILPLRIYLLAAPEVKPHLVKRPLIQLRLFHLLLLPMGIVWAAGPAILVGLRTKLYSLAASMSLADMLQL